MIALNDAQLKILMTAAADVPPEKRSTFLERVGAMLKLRGMFSDSDVDEISKLALCGLVHRTDDAA
jgi:hypothetical protein